METAPSVNGVGIVTVPVNVGEASGAKAVLVNALEPKVPPPPILSVDASVPEKPRVLLTVKVLDVVPPATENPVAIEVRVKPLTEDGVIAPNPIVKAGVGDDIDQVAVTPLFAAAVDTDVTVPPLGVTQVGAEVVPLLCNTCPAVPLASMAVVPADD